MIFRGNAHKSPPTFSELREDEASLDFSIGSFASEERDTVDSAQSDHARTGLSGPDRRSMAGKRGKRSISDTNDMESQHSILSDYGTRTRSAFLFNSP